MAAILIVVPFVRTVVLRHMVAPVGIVCPAASLLAVLYAIVLVVEVIMLEDPDTV